MSFLVGQWGTGTVGMRVLRALIEHPDLELAGVVTGDPRHVGADAAELAGTGRPLGVLATDDPAELLARRPHVICHTESGGTDAVGELCRLLEAGAGVVSDAVPSLVHPPSADRGLVRRVRAACATGGAACLTLGPGPVEDVLPLLLSGACLRIEAVTITAFPGPDAPETAGFGAPAATARRPCGPAPRGAGGGRWSASSPSIWRSRWTRCARPTSCARLPRTSAGSPGAPRRGCGSRCRACWAAAR
ncbi:hypothetical protein [Actinomadura madurae]|uniref:hypothetical protein n=1 Tax=Actinomadura madurae TaxID=1993 RepID=UPI0020D25BB4|nr:hypothetical protein [Actinomadura madurae]MCP9983676.1 hypothetical protein [Actinomadura madurae]